MNAKATEEDPISQLGFGIVAYVNILYVMVWTFILFALITAPTMMNFKTGDTYADDPRVGYANGMISNLGYSSVDCHTIPVSLGQITLSCSYGSIGKIMDFGINSDKMGSPVDACVNNEYNRKCKPTSTRIGSLLRSTIGKESATIQFSSGDFYAGGASPLCTDNTNDFFVQYTCVQSDAEMGKKYDYLSMAVGSASLISLLFFLVLQCLYKGGKITQLEWDLSTVTAGDYSVEFEIPAKAYQLWYNRVYKQSGGEFEQGYSPALSLKRTMVEQIEEAMKAEVARRKGTGDTFIQRRTTEQKELNENVAVADIVFSYNNSKLICALRDRGNNIALQKFDKVQD